MQQRELIGRKTLGAQGEITIFKLDAQPEFAVANGDAKAAERIAKGWIISHSEKGHHHLLTGGDVIERTRDVPAGMRILYAILDNPEQLIQDAATPHGAHDLAPGVYEFRIAREYNHFLEQARQVAD